MNNRTETESFPNPAALRKAQREVAKFRCLQKLNEALVGINEKFRDLHPVEQQRGGWTEQEKKRLQRSIRRLQGKQTNR